VTSIISIRYSAAIEVRSRVVTTSSACTGRVLWIHHAPAPANHPLSESPSHLHPAFLPRIRPHYHRSPSTATRAPYRCSASHLRPYIPTFLVPPRAAYCHGMQANARSAHLRTSTSPFAVRAQGEGRQANRDPSPDEPRAPSLLSTHTSTASTSTQSTVGRRAARRVETMHPRTAVSSRSAHLHFHTASKSAHGTGNEAADSSMRRSGARVRARAERGRTIHGRTRRNEPRAASSRSSMARSKARGERTCSPRLPAHTVRGQRLQSPR
jgi:hypothetical protein